ncbi:serine hydrolase FSH [Aspergillus undulatus]|uniref:serine hydrolase FSH n=1 Tax=Aspergillus undulatus TaxID=1810928 RepID=UPI003CCDDFE6
MLERPQRWPTPGTLVRSVEDTTLRLPRLVCLHGGGTNARISRSQCRALRVQLGPFFRLVLAEAPFYTTPGPDVSVYEKWGPFRAWFPPGYATGGSGSGAVPISGSPIASRIVLSSFEKSIEAAMEHDNGVGGTGTWIGLLGLSQGAKMAASLLLKQQNNCHTLQKTIDYRFAILLAGRAPLVSLSLQDELSFAASDLGGYEPALHLHMSTIHCGSARLVEWDGGHRVPIRSRDVVTVVDAILDIAQETGVIE